MSRGEQHSAFPVGCTCLTGVLLCSSVLGLACGRQDAAGPHGATDVVVPSRFYVPPGAWQIRYTPLNGNEGPTGEREAVDYYFEGIEGGDSYFAAVDRHMTERGWCALSNQLLSPANPAGKVAGWQISDQDPGPEAVWFQWWLNPRGDAFVLTVARKSDASRNHWEGFARMEFAPAPQLRAAVEQYVELHGPPCPGPEEK